jgi:hypothetical protein
VRAALAALVEGYECAQDLAASPWDFAVGLDTLTGHGCSENVLSWLVARGYAECRPANGRASATEKVAKFSRSTRFVATSKGAAVARKVQVARRASSANGAPRQRRGKLAVEKPLWDHAGSLWFRGRLIRRFRNAASDQRTILDEFERQGWPERIKNPVTRLHAVGARERRHLHNTVQNLNRDHEGPALRFLVCTATREIGWMAVE